MSLGYNYRFLLYIIKHQFHKVSSKYEYYYFEVIIYKKKVGMTYENARECIIKPFIQLITEFQA